jgi:light-regulated signal transduction histidine kinase (bacteriophytochrome)
LKNDDKVIGFLSFQTYTPDAYTQDDLSTLEALADNCGGALERIRAEEEIVRLHQELRNRLEEDQAERKRAEAEAQRLNQELERRVRERTAQLEAINKELEAFSYSVSHDLRAPLRSIRGFSEVLLERYASQLDARGQDFLRRTCQSSHHMDKLIDDLLKLSRVGRSELQHRQVNLSEVANEIVAELRKTEPERELEIVVTPGLKAMGDERLLRVAVENLLRNAWKFSNRRARARIEFGVTHDTEPAFFVRDNGAGFDMAYASRLFGVFQRLHAASEFPGTGVGLATVQRIINRHGGRTWATGKTDGGATFYFTLPNYDHAPSA